MRCLGAWGLAGSAAAAAAAAAATAAAPWGVVEEEAALSMAGSDLGTLHLSVRCVGGEGFV